MSLLLRFMWLGLFGVLVVVFFSNEYVELEVSYNNLNLTYENRKTKPINLIIHLLEVAMLGLHVQHGFSK